MAYEGVQRSKVVLPDLFLAGVGSPQTLVVKELAQEHHYWNDVGAWSDLDAVLELVERRIVELCRPQDLKEIEYMMARGVHYYDI